MSFRGIIAAGVVGVIAWAVRRNMQDATEQSGVAYVMPVAQAAPKQNAFEKLGGVLDIFSAAKSIRDGLEPASTSFPQPTAQNGSSRVSGLLDLIGRAEAPAGYDQIYGGSKVRPPKPITQMTVGEVRAFQDKMVSAGSVSSAVGRYQIIRNTMDGLIRKGTLDRNELFSKDAQDRAATSLMQGRGLDRFLSGDLSETDFANNLAKEWAGLPVVTNRNGHNNTPLQAGQSYYDNYAGNSATVAVSDVLSALRRV